MLGPYGPSHDRNVFVPIHTQLVPGQAGGGSFFSLWNNPTDVVERAFVRPCARGDPCPITSLSRFPSLYWSRIYPYRYYSRVLEPLLLVLERLLPIPDGTVTMSRTRTRATTRTLGPLPVVVESLPLLLVLAALLLVPCAQDHLNAAHRGGTPRNGAKRCHRGTSTPTPGVTKCFACQQKRTRLRRIPAPARKVRPRSTTRTSAATTRIRNRCYAYYPCSPISTVAYPVLSPNATVAYPALKFLGEHVSAIR